MGSRIIPKIGKHIFIYETMTDIKLAKDITEIFQRACDLK